MEHTPAWLLNSLIYLGAAVLAVPLARALGLGSIIGYLAAGIAIGPWGLGLVGNVQDILHFAEFGVVLMLFLVGLELQPQRLWSLRRPIFGWGGAQLLLCAAALAALAIAFGVEWKIALVAALGLALSSTAIALQVMGERNMLPTTSGQATFSILLFQDVAAIPILALVPLLGAVVGDGEAAQTSNRLLEAGKILGVVGAIVIGGRLLIRPTLSWIARSRAPEVFTAASLLLVVAIAALMLSLGLSMALGAFLAGVLLADSEYRRELETDIEPFKGLLLGLFFIAVGMSIDFGVLAASPGLIALIVLGLFVVKGFAIFALGLAMDLPRQERPMFVLLLAQGGEFAFVVFQAAAGARVFTAETASLLIGAVALSMLISPLLLVALDKWMASQRRALDGDARMPELAEPQDAPIIICGYGRYGQIIGRLLLAHDIPVTVLDHDAAMIETARSFGYQVHYGDATRLDLLRTAGAAGARIIVIAVDDVEQSLDIVRLVHEHFPRLEIVARAHDVTHWNKLRDEGVTYVQRELFESSLNSARSVLELLGTEPEEAHWMITQFRQNNIALADRMYPHYKDRAKLIAVAKEARAQLVQQMSVERAERHRQPQPTAPAIDAAGTAQPRAAAASERGDDLRVEANL